MNRFNSQQAAVTQPERSLGIDVQIFCFGNDVNGRGVVISASRARNEDGAWRRTIWVGDVARFDRACGVVVVEVGRVCCA